MKKMSELMAELGFNKNAPNSVKEAFLKNLIKNTTGVAYQAPTEKNIQNPAEQMCFDFESVAHIDDEISRRKSS